MDIATSCVRAAELKIRGGEYQLQHFGQMPLPVGAVVDGQVRDAPTVGEAIRQLWKTAKFSSRTVSIGVGNQQVEVDLVDVPFTPAKTRGEDVASLVGDRMAMSVRGSVLDYVHLTTMDGQEGEVLSRGLLVAAAEEPVLASISAAEYGGLKVRDVDLTSFALVRALGSGPTVSLTEDVEVILDIGATTATMVVHDHGVPQFVRIHLLGGQAITDRLMADLGVNLPTAESIKREMALSEDSGVGSRGANPQAIVTEESRKLVDEIRSSLVEYFATSDSPRVSRVLLTGGGSLIPGLQESLSDAIGALVEPGSALAALGSGKSGLSEEHIAFADPFSAACVGLAIRVDR